MLHVWIDQTLRQQVPAACGVTIGSDPLCDVPIPDAAVAPLHASIDRDADQVLCIRTRCDTKLHLRGGKNVAQQPLRAEMEIVIGPALIRCIELQPTAPPSRVLPLDPRQECVNCREDLRSLPGHARFCPRCGSRIFDWSHGILADGEALHAPSSSSSGQSSLTDIITGYAAAMNHLGVHYERSLGARRNYREALRCFFKAARAGNPAAVAELHRRGLEPRLDQINRPMDKV